MRLSITVLATLALALVAQGIPIPNPTGSGDEGGNTTPPPHPPSNPPTPPQPPLQHHQTQPQAPNSPSVPGQYTRRTSEIHSGSVGWVQPSRFSPPQDSRAPHPFIADNTPSPGGTVHGFGATHGIIGDGRNNQPANRYVTDPQHGSFQANAEGHQTNINVHNRQRTNSGNFYDSPDHRLPTHITPAGMQQLHTDHQASQRGSTSRPRVSMRGLGMAMRGLGTTPSRGRRRGDSNAEPSRGRTSSRGNRGGGGGGDNAESSRSSSRGSRRGASADRQGQHRTAPY